MALQEIVIRAGVDKLACPHCQFTEIVPGSNQTPARFMQLQGNPRGSSADKRNE